MFQTLPGFREFYPEDCAIRNHIFRQWRHAASRFGFSEFDGPVLEPLELFTQKSGEEIVSQLFDFKDRGGRHVAMRPEMTPTLARLVGSKAASLRRPIKWFCIGENFRYERPQKGRLRSFYQFNADLLGEAGPGADAEIIALAIGALTSFGLAPGDFVVRLSDRTLWLHYLAAYGIVDDRALAVLSIVDKIEREAPEKIIEKLQAYFGDGAAAFVGKIHTLVALRSLDGLREFFLGHDCAPEIRAKLEARLGDWAELLGRLTAMGLGDFVRIDFGVVRGLAYYTGFVFELFQTVGTARALAGGGRYDNLVKKLGGPDLPAVGFGMGDVTLRDLLEEKGLVPPYVDKPDVFVVIGGAQEREAALADVSRLRQAGLRVEYALKEANFGKQFKQADQTGARFALVYGSEELAANAVKVRDLVQRAEKLYPRRDVAAVVRAAMEEGALPERE